jgi:hypothetical protein
MKFLERVSAVLVMLSIMGFNVLAQYQQEKPPPKEKPPKIINVPKEKPTPKNRNRNKDAETKAVTT